MLNLAITDANLPQQAADSQIGTIGRPFAYPVVVIPDISKGRLARSPAQPSSEQIAIL